MLSWRLHRLCLTSLLRLCVVTKIDKNNTIFCRVLTGQTPSFENPHRMWKRMSACDWTNRSRSSFISSSGSSLPAAVNFTPHCSFRCSLVHLWMEKGNVFRFYLLLLTFHCVNVSCSWVTMFVTRHCRVLPPSSNNNMALGEKPARPKPQYKDSTSLWWMWNETIPRRLLEPWEASCYGFVDSQSSLSPSHPLIPGIFMPH